MTFEDFTSVPLVATYRVQFRAEFGFASAVEIVDYLAQLGVSHLYASPYLQATPGSTHGYDIVDHGHANDELGGEVGRKAMVDALRANDLGQVLDIVPNHMAIGGRNNKWWWSILASGRESPYCDYFDIDWRAPEELGRDVVLMPVLGDHYGKELDRRRLQLGKHDDEVVVRYFESEFPISTRSLQEMSVDVSEGGLAALNDDPTALDALLERQHYRLCYWRVADSELDYRRFFDINSLVGLRAERDDVFEDTHRRILDWIDEGSVSGLRIDHVDGLADPLGYLRRLRSRVGERQALFVEKILESGERLPASWPVSGTTGYDALNLIDGLFIEPTAASGLADFYRTFTGNELSWRQHVRDGKRYVIERLLRSDVARVTDVLMRFSRSRRQYRDYTRDQLHVALCALLVELPVYRTYTAPSGNQVTRIDREIVRRAVEQAKHDSTVEPDLLDLLDDLLALAFDDAVATEFVVRFQQLSGPVMAKGVEDTAYYRYLSFVALNEVGGDPGEFAVRPDDFHEACAERQRSSPSAMNASTTHDTKRSEDVRWRLAVLTEMADKWTTAVARWSAMNERHRRLRDPADSASERFPDRNMEYLLYQTLVGAYPVSVERLTEYAIKAAREAKQFTSWNAPDALYEDALRGFVDAICNNTAFQDDVADFVEPIIHVGRINSLAATLLKVTMPGVPDLYQGTELWSLDLVDPDNRRLVDYGQRRELINELNELPIDEIAKRADEGLTKMHVLTRSLHARKHHPDCFDERGAYAPLVAVGAEAHNVVGFQRGNDVVVVVPRLVAGMDGWTNTTVELPKGQWRNVFTDHIYDGETLLRAALNEFPVALLERIGES